MKSLTLEKRCKPEFPFTLDWNVKHRRFEMHEHSFTELVTVLSGSAIHITSFGTEAIEAGSIFMIMPGEIHGYDISGGNFEMVNILFDIDHIPMFDLRKLPEFNRLSMIGPQMQRTHGKTQIKLDSSQLHQARALLSKLNKELRKKSPGHQAMSIALFIEFLVTISRFDSDEKKAKRNTTVDGLSHLMSWLEANYHQEVSLDELSEIAGMSKRNFQRLFRQTIGFTPFEYLVRLRLDKAAEQLRLTDKSISSVAMDSGFMDSNYFAKRFKQARGCSPREYRRMKSI